MRGIKKPMVVSEDFIRNASLKELLSSAENDSEPLAAIPADWIILVPLAATHDSGYWCFALLIKSWSRLIYRGWGSDHLWIKIMDLMNMSMKDNKLLEIHMDVLPESKLIRLRPSFLKKNVRMMIGRELSSLEIDFIEVK